MRGDPSHPISFQRTTKSKFTFPKSIKSRPVYGTLEARDGSAHVFVADAHGAEANLKVATPEMMANAHIIHISKGEAVEGDLRALNPASFFAGPSYSAAEPRLRKALSDA